jgi:lambda repressor-like predicted transcriptional regulator
MRRSEVIIANTPVELANALGLSCADAVELDVRRQLNDKIVAAAKRAGCTHAELAARAGVSRTRLTAILNRNTRHVSTDLMLRILAALGYSAKITFRRQRPAA